jgi:hypothetical protein
MKLARSRAIRLGVVSEAGPVGARRGRPPLNWKAAPTPREAALLLAYCLIWRIVLGAKPQPPPYHREPIRYSFSEGPTL